jgi:putative N6-adenine-specific DNA methylase
MRIEYIAPCLFGLESVLAGEVKRMGGEDVRVSDGKVEFAGDINLLARANLTLRTAERVLIKLGEFDARSFTELFDNVRALPLEQFIGKQDAFPVKGYSLHSTLHSVPDCQKIIKKAAVERLHEKYGVSWFEETGPVHQLQFSILKDRATILLDSSGAGLHKRGYRKNANEAPIKETLAAGMLDLAFVKKDSQLYDPFCGSGTIIIEAALRAINMPAGINRTFAAEKWDSIPSHIWKEERTRGLDLIRKDARFCAYGSDIDRNAVELALQNAYKAGVAERVRIRIRDVKDFKVPETPSIVVTNPPYGERLLDVEQARAIETMMGRVFRRGTTGYYIISPDEEFESHFGRKANKKRKLYNGMLKCNFYMYYGDRPPKDGTK